MGGAEGTEEQAYFSLKETQRIWLKKTHTHNQKKKKKNTDGESSWILQLWLQPEINMKNSESPKSEQLRRHLWLHLGAVLKSHLEFPESQVITFELFPKPIFWESPVAGMSDKNNAVSQLPRSSLAPCPQTPGRRTMGPSSGTGDRPLREPFSFSWCSLPILEFVLQSSWGNDF